MAVLRQAMARDAGVLRDRDGLTRLLGVIDGLEAGHGRALPLVAARLIAAAALARKESRGGHFRNDFPCMASPARRTLITLEDVTPVRQPEVA
jgi:L-aspartate oxidase